MGDLVGGISRQRKQLRQNRKLPPGETAQKSGRVGRVSAGKWWKVRSDR